MFRVGKIEIHLVSDGQVMVDGGGPFGLVPRKLWSRVIKPTDDNLVPMFLTCALVKAGGKNILIDTGMGSNRLDEKSIANWGITRPNGSVLDGLARLGIAPDGVDIVLNTHLHSDHCTGNTFYDDDGNPQPTFPRAQHYVHRLEYDDAMNPNERTRATYFADSYAPLVESGQMTLIDEDEAEILPGIRMVRTPGHTPGHMSVLFESNDEHGMFICDLAGFAVNFERLAWISAYDVEPLITLENKRKWQQWALEHDALLFLVHDSLIPAARLVEDEQGRPRMQSVEAVFA
jgi:glyoxylase-like metal-dependent hydrolase (beta-lactamase superfamily II)